MGETLTKEGNIMYFYELNGKEANIREGNPRVAKIMVRAGEYLFCLIGTDYGYMHTSGGDVRTWGSYSGAMGWLVKNYSYEL